MTTDIEGLKVRLYQAMRAEMDDLTTPSLGHAALFQNAYDAITALEAERDGLKACPMISLSRSDLENYYNELRNVLAATEDKLAGCVEALTNIRDGGEPRPVGERWRKDGKPSKEDLCIHGNPMWEDCFGCVSDYTRAALARLENKEL